MRKLKDFFDKVFNLIPGHIFGILSFIFGIVYIIIALLLTPEYIMWRSSISYLGIQTGGIFLRIGLIISNIFSIPFIISLGRALKDKNTNENIRKIAVLFGILSSLSVILTGVFTGGGIISDLHGLFALLSWIGGAITCSIFGLLMLKSPNFTKVMSAFSIIIGGIFATYLIPFFITIICSYVCYSFGEMVYQIMPVWEWGLIFSTLLWYLFNSIYIKLKGLVKTNYEISKRSD
ncbi:MAG: hypothetical protein ACFE9C_01735 [Candidatus Hodarchaeota archaeon]